MWQNLSQKSKKLLGIIAAVTLLVIVVAVVLIAKGQKTEYQTLFSSLSQSEAQQVVSLLQEQNVPYLYDGKSGSLKVPSQSVDTLRAQLLSKGYPKSGFAYNMYIGNSGLMTTESDKKQYTLYDLQDRLGATIRLFDGVRDAKVTIAEGTEQNYAIESDNPIQASASVVVTMDEGQTLSEKNAEAIKNLVARSVKGMTFTKVSVFDAGTMEEVAADAEDGASGSGTSMANLTATVENNIATNIKRVLLQLLFLQFLKGLGIHVCLDHFFLFFLSKNSEAGKFILFLFDAFFHSFQSAHINHHVFNGTSFPFDDFKLLFIMMKFLSQVFQKSLLHLHVLQFHSIFFLKFV